jgi:hypothetical protein
MIKLTLIMPVEDSEDAEAELDALAEYIEERLTDGSSVQQIAQSMVEALAGLADDDVSTMLH